jgi:hypothetical protein
VLAHIKLPELSVIENARLSHGPPYTRFAGPEPG